ncbi:hypothetical protein Q765_16345 [Flavobacterium rivuli WB 3.3-2 = DSM 21788]|uniref:Uncharacterized protein n=1 Tax=Flavobacterium rivuli WB 3.3-2 = DSM 21788 TaxID=1121895 RepID=A0A0A2M1E2_9FLAO|nr:hypothetical protein [Flavobacterium rivuli]KGO85436.1 hypothetical protein Q765_16345 [Flavobacterium rivuli WB 3.3-2 = DSM 21788]
MEDFIIEALGDCDEHVEETFTEFTNRYDGFGKDFYLMIKDSLPLVFEKLKFYKATVRTGKCVGVANTKDSFAIFEGNVNKFVIQLSYYGVICLCDIDTNFIYETGDWSDNAYKEALEFVSTHFDKDYDNSRISG